MCMTMRIIITRKEAFNRRLDRFFTGAPCKNGHVAERIVKTYKCIQCKREWEIKWRKENPKKDKAIRAREVRKNRESYRRRFDEYAKRKGKEYLSDLRRAYKRNNKDKVNANVAERRAKKLQATPLWYDMEKGVIESLYERAETLTEETGIQHHVDHVIPLQHERICGLHCLANLQILTDKDNLEKSNKFN